MTSPSLDGSGRTAFELKFSLTAPLREAVLAWVQGRLTPDPFGDADGRYETTTLYFDTPDRAVFHRAPRFRTSKYRIRRYGSEDLAFYERKRRRGNRVKKIRESGHSAPIWFEQERCMRRLEPALWVRYARHAYVADGGLRLTMDEDLRSWPISLAPPPNPLPNFVREGEPGPHSLEPLVLELKFADHLPTLFRELICAHRLMPTSCSKYRVAMADYAAVEGLQCRIS